MKKAITCTGYALAGAGIVLGVLAGLGLIVFVAALVGSYVGDLVGVGKDEKVAISFVFILACIGAAFGAAACAEQHRYTR